MARRPNPPRAPAPPTTPHPLHTPIKVSFRLYEAGGRFCLSHAGKDDARHFLDSLRVFTSMTWEQVRSQGGRPGNKSGLAYTPYRDHDLRVPRPDNVSPDLRIDGFRAGSGQRIFGVSIENVFHILWFDPEHAIVPG